MQFKITTFPVLAGLLWACLFPAQADESRRTLTIGTAHVLTVGEQGTLWAWGANESGQLGLADNNPRLEPARVGGDNRQWSVATAGRNHSAAIDTNGFLYTWGGNENGQLGLGHSENRNAPTLLNNENDWVAVAASEGWTLALKADGSLWGWGSNAFGQLAENNFRLQTSLLPRLISSENHTAIAVGLGHALAIRADGSLYAWGRNSTRQLGLGLDASRSFTPTRIGQRSDWAQVFAGPNNSFALTADGQLFAWGNNFGNLLAIPGNASQVDFPTQVLPPDNYPPNSWASLEVGYDHCLALLLDGSLWGWGNNSQGQLGYPTRDAFNQRIEANAAFPRPVPVANDTIGATWQALAAGTKISLLQQSDGGILGMGLNSAGQLGTGNTFSPDTPTPSTFGIPDLIITSVDLASGNLDAIQPGSEEDVSVSFKNRGTGTLPPESAFRIEVRLSRDGFFSPNDEIVGTGTFSTGLSSQESEGINVRIALPEFMASGDWYLVAFIDSDRFIFEGDENNNFGSSDAFMLLSDFSPEISNLPASNAPIPQGGTLAFDLNILNEGFGDLEPNSPEPLNYSIYLGEEPILRGNKDIILRKNISINERIPGENQISIPLIINLLPSTPPGDYYIIAVLNENRSILESSFDNNESASAQTITVEGLTVEEALDFPTIPLESDSLPLIFTTGGDGRWLADINEEPAPDLPTNPAPSVMRSPDLDEGERAFFQAIADGGPFIVTFYWKISAGSQDNFIRFTIDGAEPVNARLSGNSGDWRQASFILPSNRNTLRWTYHQNTVPTGREEAYVDFVRLERLTLPDLTITNVDYQPGPYIQSKIDRTNGRLILRDNDITKPLTFTLIGRNAGQTINIEQLASQLLIRVYLSRNANLESDLDFFISEVNFTQVQGLNQEPITTLRPNDRFVYDGSIHLPELDLTGKDLPPGDYHLIFELDSTRAVTEADEENNSFTSTLPDIQAQRLPDLTFPQSGTTENLATSIVHTPGVFQIGERFIINEFSVTNDGLSDLPEDPETGLVSPFRVDIVVSTNTNLTGDQDNLATMLSIADTSGLPFGQSRTFRTVFDVPQNVPVGRLLYLAAVLDPAIEGQPLGAIAEMAENNNRLLSSKRELVFSAITLPRALELDRLPTENAYTLDTNNDLTGIDQGADFPWVGVRDFFREDQDAARSVAIGNSQRSSFSINTTFANDTVLRFHWTVDSERRVVVGGLKEDILSFSINGETRSAISGAVRTDLGWLEERYFLPAGDYTFEWAYEKDQSDAVGLDAGWVDNIRWRVADLNISNLSFPAPGTTLQPGDPLPLSFDVTNLGDLEVRSFRYTIYLSRDALPGNSGDRIIARRVVSTTLWPLDQFASDPTRNTLSEVSLSSLDTIPEDLSFGGNYHIILELETVDAEEVEAVLTNNLAISNPTDLFIQLPVSIETAAQDAASGDDPFVAEWNTFGDGFWFPVVNDPANPPADPTFTPNADGSAAVQSPRTLLEDQSSSLAAVIQGPVSLSFQWQINSPATSNSLAFAVDGIKRLEIRGQQPWTEVTDIFIPAGFHQISWTFTKAASSDPFGSAQPDIDVGWIDAVRTAPITKPELVMSDFRIGAPPPADAALGGFVLDRPKVFTDDFDYTRSGSLPVSLTIENQGIELAGQNINGLEVELRLSVDTEFGNSDDIILDRILRAEQVQSGQIFAFGGDVPLDISIPAGSYFVLARVNPFEAIDEVDLTNNILTSSQRINILTLPDLSIGSLANFWNPSDESPPPLLDRSRLWHPGQPIQYDFQITNDGLADLTTDTPFKVRVNLAAISAAVLFLNWGDFDNIVTNTSTTNITLEEMDFRHLLPGRGVDAADNPIINGLHILRESNLPNAGQLDAFSEANNFGPMDSLAFFFIIELDTLDRVTETDERNAVYLWPYAFFIRQPESPVNFSSWLDTLNTFRSDPIWDEPFGPGPLPAISSSPQADDDGDGFPNWVEFALSRNPGYPETSGNLLTAYTRTRIDGQDVLTISFEFNNRANDDRLQLIVEASDDQGRTWEENILTLNPPYTALLGPRSLNGAGGLTSLARPGPNGQGSFRPVLEATDHGAVAGITIRDNQPSIEGSPRMLRLRIPLPQSQGQPSATRALRSGSRSFAIAPYLPSGSPKGGLPLIHNSIGGEIFELHQGWAWSPWLGFFHDANAPWIYHPNHTWLYWPENNASTQSTHLYDSTLGWIWTNQQTFPFLFHYNTANWFYYFPQSGSSDTPRWFQHTNGSFWSTDPRQNSFQPFIQD